MAAKKAAKEKKGKYADFIEGEGRVFMVKFKGSKSELVVASIVRSEAQEGTDVPAVLFFDLLRDHVQSAPKTTEKELADLMPVPECVAEDIVTRYGRIGEREADEDSARERCGEWKKRLAADPTGATTPDEPEDPKVRKALLDTANVVQRLCHILFEEIVPDRQLMALRSVRRPENALPRDFVMFVREFGRLSLDHQNAVLQAIYEGVPDKDMHGHPQKGRPGHPDW